MGLPKAFYRTQRYREWRAAVYRRDNFVCRLCQEKGQYIEGHHILPKMWIPNLTFDVSNGIALCAKGNSSCHKLITDQEFLWVPVLAKIVDEDIWDKTVIIKLIEREIGVHPLLSKLKGQPFKKSRNRRRRPRKPKRIRRIKTVR